MSTKIIYASSLHDERFVTWLKITAEGLSTLLLGSNSVHRGSAIGRFETALPVTTLQRLLQTVTSQGFNAAPTQEHLCPEESYREFIVMQPDGGQVIKTVGEQLPSPPLFNAADTMIQTVIEQVRRTPVTAVAMRIAAAPDRIVATKREAGKPATAHSIDLVLRNMGRSPLHLEAPHTWGTALTQCTLRAVRSDLPSDKLKPSDQQFVQLNTELFIKAVPPITENLLPLNPGEQVGVRFQYAFDWPVGHYQLEISVVLPFLREDGRVMFTGRLLSDPRELEVLKP